MSQVCTKTCCSFTYAFFAVCHISIRIKFSFVCCCVCSHFIFFCAIAYEQKTVALFLRSVMQLSLKFSIGYYLSPPYINFYCVPFRLYRVTNEKNMLLFINKMILLLGIERTAKYFCVESLFLYREEADENI